MKKGMFYKGFIYFLCFSFLLLMNGFSRMGLEARETERPLAEMISRGDVKFEVRENIWKNVESSHFPLFKGTRVKTEKGQAIVRLPDNGKVEVHSGSLFSFDSEGKLTLTQGSLRFSLPVTSDLTLRIGNLSITRARILQASQGSSSFPSTDSLVSGTVSIHANGSVTVKTLEGKVQVLGPDHSLLAAIPKNDSVTLPSITVTGPQRVMVAQAGETSTTTETKGAFLGISTWGWVGIIAGAAVIAGVAIAASGGGDGGDWIPICP